MQEQDTEKIAISPRAERRGGFPMYKNDIVDKNIQ